MTSTKKTTKTAETNAIDGMTFGDVEGGKKVGGFTPAWVPHFRELTAEDRAEKLATLGAGSTFRADIAGTLSQELCFEGTKDERVMYHVNVKIGGDDVKFRLPEHASLWGALAFVPLGEFFKAVYVGRGAKPKDAKKDKPHVYDVTCAKAAKDKRADALKIVKRNDDE